MSVFRSLIAPLAFVWDYSSIVAPAREAVSEADHWSDYLAATLYLAFAAGMLLFLAQHISTGFVVGALVVLSMIVALKFARYRYFQ